jgi:hypothetical protein
MPQNRLAVTGLAVCLLAGGARAQEEAAPEKARLSLEQLSGRAAALKLAFAEAPEGRAPQLTEAPIMRTSDVTREEEDGAVWLWLEGKRPVAGLCLIHKRGRWNYELVSLTDEALKVTGRPTWSWQPQAAPRHWTAIDEPVPGGARARQSALRAIARRFAASEVRRGDTFPLRLIDRPVYTYSDTEHNIVEGGLFAMSYGTNPEALVQVEARDMDGKTQWHVAFARLSAAEVTVRLGEEEIWKTDELLSEADYKPTDAYYAIGERPMPE